MKPSLKDQALDIEKHLALMNEARDIIHTENKIAADPIGQIEVDHIPADLKLRLARKLDEEALAVAASSDSFETMTAEGEMPAAAAVSMCLPEERLRIAELLALFPPGRETKIDKLLRGRILGQLNDRLSYDQLYREALSDPELKRIRLLHDHLEPTLQRELCYRGIAGPEKGYATELPAWVEVL